MLLQQLLRQLSETLGAFWGLLFNPIVFIPALIYILIQLKTHRDYKNSAYYKITKLPYSSVKHDTGRFGEYLTYKYLKKFEDAGAKFLFNVYIPKGDGETTEIDVLMICLKGIFVFESKNYSGWIFGSEGQKNWYQTLPTGRGKSHKENFYNPIMQNRTHIKHLKLLLGEQYSMKSIIVFSPRCTLKSVQLSSSDVCVIKRDSVADVVSDICNKMSVSVLSDSEIENLYDRLYPYTQVDSAVKNQHIANIRNTLNSKTAQASAEAVVSSEQTQQQNTPVTEQTVSEDISIEFADDDKQNAEKSEEKTVGASETVTAESDIEAPQIPKCPKCNSTLVLRTASRGANSGKQFYGCSNYPKCKYIQNIN